MKTPIRKGRNGSRQPTIRRLRQKKILVIEPAIAIAVAENVYRWNLGQPNPNCWAG
ncbi:hypothetical protein IT397_03125 [Candidatus Nomurabacteria bacterium]|nr:hypothetical protein [Candidatus Nomurabacteria bacterium]